MAMILVVEDEFAIASLLVDVLTDDGHRVLTAANGRQALDRMAVERPDLILSDYMMPVMDGGALLDALASDDRFRSIPVVLMSSMPEDAVAARCSGFAQFVRKPFSIYAVQDLVAKLLSLGR